MSFFRLKFEISDKCTGWTKAAAGSGGVSGSHPVRYVGDIVDAGKLVIYQISVFQKAKNENDLRSKLKKTLKTHSVTEDDQVKFMIPKFDMEMDDDVLNRLVGF